mgnify:CR=1 FL=1
MISKNNDQFKLKNIQTKVVSNQIVTEELFDSETVNEIINNAIVSVVDRKKEQLQIQIKKIVKKNNFILVGSSMGAWISLNQFKVFNKQIIGFLGIGSAPEFLENLMWKKFNKSMKREITQKGIINLKHGKYEYPITLQLIKDGRKNKILKKNINQKLNVTMVHGEKDESVPVVYSRKVLKLFKNARKKLVIIKNGDHSLSSKRWLKILTNELSLIL